MAGKIKEKIIKELKAKKNKATVIPPKFEEKIGIDRAELKKAMQELKKENYFFVVPGTYGHKGTHLKDESKLTRQQQRVLNEMKIGKDSEFIKPRQLHKKIGTSQASLNQVLNKLREKGYDIREEPSKLRDKILEHSYNSKGVIFTPYKLSEKIGVTHQELGTEKRHMKKNGYEFGKVLSKTEQELLEKSMKEKNKYRLPDSVLEEMALTQVRSGMKKLKEKGFEIDFKLSEKEKKLLEVSKKNNGKRLIRQETHKRVGVTRKELEKITRRVEKKRRVKFKKDVIIRRKRD
mgnify:CR=1 FL=1